jgi:chromate transport protein ChrA
VFQHNSGTPGAISTKLGTHMTIYIYQYCIIYTYKWMYVCLWVCMFQHTSGTPGAISTKLGTHVTIYISKNIILYIIYIYIYINGCMYVCLSDRRLG